jgi:hypothetical protein
MSDRRRIRLDEVLRESLPGWVPVAEGHGHWRTAAGPASWELEPADSGFWLVLGARLDTSHPARSPLADASAWPWPLKPIRREPGAELLWSAELHLSGQAVEMERVQALSLRLENWLSDADRRSTSHDPSPEAADADQLAQGKDVIVRALGGSLKRTAHGFRLSSQDGPALVLNASGEEWVLRATLVRNLEPLSPGASRCLDDFLAVANGRLRGCRGFHEVQGGGTTAVLESRISRESLNVRILRATVDCLLGSARRLAPACQILLQQPKVGELYRELLIGEGRENTKEQG